MSKVGTSIDEAVEILKRGGLVAIPTETVYGLGANALNKSAVLKVFAAKKRPSFDPLIVHSTKDKIFNWAKTVPEKARILADAIWPGPLTLILTKTDDIPYEVTSGLDTVGLRVPNHPLALQLLERLDFPLSAPSANPFAYISPTTAQHVFDSLKDEIDYILNGGESQIGIESTIIAFDKEIPTVYRLGGLSIEDIEKVIGHVQVQINTSSNPKTPGSAKMHYAPLKPMFLVDDFSQIEDDATTAYITFHENLDIENQRQFSLSTKGDYYEAAARLYALLRELDESDFRRIVAKRLPEESLGRAINDRLQRASARYIKND
ncbi:MAG: L-threonylcarbamoyladenylate synthase [Chitinophagales bacterium]|nr:L-threonylcarbamoyladenylate synthase [Chitinophagales bacterium]